MNKLFLKRQYEEHKFYIGYIFGILTWIIILGLCITISLCVKFITEAGR